MRRSAVLSIPQGFDLQARNLALAILGIMLVGLAGCGGHSSSTTAPSAVQISPSPLSLNLGGVASLTATVVDSTGAAVTVTTGFTYASSNSSVATVSTAGSVCAGKWDANFIVCDTTGVQPGTATITVTNGSVNGTVTVYTHLHVDRVTVSPGSINCISSTQTQQMSAHAFSNGVDITPTVGPFNWQSSIIDVATVDANGSVTAKTPGQGGIIASVSSVFSPSAPWTTCPVQSVNIHVSGATDTKFTLAAASTNSLAADVLDSHGLTVSVPLTWSSSVPTVATINSSALVTAVAAGTTGLTASCAVSCNIGLAPVYSNVVIGSVSGSSTTTVYAAGTSSTSLVPIDATANTAGTAITLPSMPNSLLFNSLGTTAILGSSAGYMSVDTTTNAVTQNTGVQGTVLAVSPDSNRIIVAGTNTLFVVGIGSGIATETSPIAAATAASFSPDSRNAYILAGTNLYFWTAGGSFKLIALGGAASDVKFLANNAFAYIAGGASGPAVTARATCDNSLADTVIPPGAPNLVASLPDASALVAADSPGLDVIAVTTNHVGCPPPLSDTLTHLTYGVAAFTPKQLIVLADGTRAYETGSPGQLLGVTTSSSTPFTIPLANGATPLTGGATLDATKLYVGGSDNNVHRIDVASGTDAQQISVSFTPNLVAVRPK